MKMKTTSKYDEDTYLKEIERISIRAFSDTPKQINLLLRESAHYEFLLGR